MQLYLNQIRVDNQLILEFAVEVGWTDATVQTEVEAMTVLTDKPEVGQTDATLLVEELTGIYSTPTPKGWHGAKKESNLY